MLKKHEAFFILEDFFLGLRRSNTFFRLIMKNTTYRVGDGFHIRHWAEQDRPREKLLNKGKSFLTDAELLGILIATGTKSLSAIDLARSVLNEFNHDLNTIARLDAKELQRIKGIGEAKAIAIISAFELGRRRNEIAPNRKFKITSSSDVYKLMRPVLLDQPTEHFWIILLNRANQVLKKLAVSMGGVSGTLADPKVIFKHALNHLASSIILVHNHPSGTLKPSEADIRLTSQLKSSGKMLDIPVLDHLIFTDESYFSFSDEGIL